MYKIKLDKKAADFLRKLDHSNQERISKKLDSLKTNPQAGDPLTANLSGLWKLRIGDYRAIYKIQNEELIILVLKLGHRKNVYE
ncbi:MAG: type II toxin-antitoxin system RelE/ParE family toxin [archaeon]